MVEWWAGEVWEMWWTCRRVGGSIEYAVVDRREQW
jgi:hypothetical protein